MLGNSRVPPGPPRQQPTHGEVLLLLKSCLLLPQPVPELIHTLVHGRHLGTALIQTVPLLLQLCMLLLIQLVSQLRRREGEGRGNRESKSERTNENKRQRKQDLTKGESQGSPLRNSRKK